MPRLIPQGRNRPNVYQMIYDVPTETCYVYIGNNPDPSQSTKILQEYRVKLFSEIAYYFNALALNIGYDNVGINHIEGANGLDKIFIGKGKGSGNPLIPPPPIVTVINNYAYDTRNHGYAVRWFFDDGDTLQDYYITANVGAGIYVVPKISYLVANSISFYALFDGQADDGTGIGNIDILLYKDGEVEQAFNNLNGKFINISPAVEYDTIVINPHAVAAPSILNWQFTKTGVNNSSFKILDDDTGNVFAEVTTGALAQAGSFPVYFGQTLDIQTVITNGNGSKCAIKITNVTDGIVIYNATNDVGFNYQLLPEAGKSYKVDFVTNEF